jgi:hypothetical protein
VHEQVDVVGLAVELAQLGLEVAAGLPHHLFAEAEHVIVEDAAPVLRHEDQVRVKRRNYVPATPVIVIRIIALSWDGLAVPAIAEQLGCHPNKVRRWLHRL